MIISLKAPYKSLAPFTSELPTNFCVITGKNGSGKSQLIELIQAKIGDLNSNFELDVDRFRIQIEGLNHPTASALEPGMWNQKITEFWSDYTTRIHLMPTLEALSSNRPDISLLTISQEELSHLISEAAADEVKKGLDSVKTFSHPDQIPIKDYCNIAASQILEKRYSYEVARSVAQKQKKPLFTISHQDFKRFPPDEKFLDRQSLFQSSIERIFYAYAKRRYLNWLHHFANEDLNREYHCLPDKEFVKIHQPP